MPATDTEREDGEKSAKPYSELVPVGSSQKKACPTIAVTGWLLLWPQENGFLTFPGILMKILSTCTMMWASL